MLAGVGFSGSMAHAMGSAGQRLPHGLTEAQLFREPGWHRKTMSSTVPWMIGPRHPEHGQARRIFGFGVAGHRCFPLPLAVDQSLGAGHSESDALASPWSAPQGLHPLLPPEGRGSQDGMASRWSVCGRPKGRGAIRRLGSDKQEGLRVPYAACRHTTPLLFAWSLGPVFLRFTVQRELRLPGRTGRTDIRRV